ncbi:FHA domain-containing protein [Undibacterium seohonense]|nr:FHA domain-containing protein [Undibacterium seohonense]
MLLKDETSQQWIYIRALHVFGRSRLKADTTLSNLDASQIHASIRWNGQIWELLDHSRNGTFVNGQRLLTDQRFVLVCGQELQFGPHATSKWKVACIAAPQAMLIPIDCAAPVINLSEPQFLPDNQAPQVSIYRSARGHYLWQDLHDSVILRDGDLLTLAPHRWRFFDVQKEEVTLNIRQYQSSYQVYDQAKVSFSFTVSQNEEHVILDIKTPKRQASLGERTHHYGLLTMARQRMQDALRGLDISTQGWLGIEKLSRMLGVEPAHLNMQLFRARGQIAREFPDQSELLDVIERRRGEVRFAAIPFEITRGSCLESRFDPASFV